MTTNVIAPDSPSVHIGQAAHTSRNMLLAVGGVAVMLLLIGMFAWRTGRSDTAALTELNQFRQAMYDRCKDPQFSGPADPQLAALYADSSRMRTVVVAQYHLLQRDDANCDSVQKSLRGADYPVK